MNQPTASIRGELSDALVCGIRRRGPDAVGLLIMGLARLIVATAALGALLGVGALFGYDISAAQFAGLTGISALVTWLMADGRSRSAR